jgi:hypothetical protein
LQKDAKSLNEWKKEGLLVSKTVQSSGGWEKDDECVDELVDDPAQKQTIFILPFVVVFFVRLVEEEFGRERKLVAYGRYKGGVVKKE